MLNEQNTRRHPHHETVIPAHFVAAGLQVNYRKIKKAGYKNIGYACKQSECLRPFYAYRKNRLRVCDEISGLQRFNFCWG